MTPNNKVLLLLLTVISILAAPYIGLYIHAGGIPENFFHFPATAPIEKPGPNWLVITLTCVAWLAFLLLYLFPGIYGFKRTSVPSTAPRRIDFRTQVTAPKPSLPRWFWIGLFLWLCILVVFALKLSGPKWLLDWALLPLWWGFILVLDGIVYYRNGGDSLVKNAPTELVAMGVLAISGWLIFEYFNFYTKLNWYYPFATRMTHPAFLMYAFVGSSAFIPMCFEWYHLLRTFPKMNTRWANGPKKKWSNPLKIVVVILAFAGLFLNSFFPDSLFYMMWLAPLFILTIAVGWLGIWTPFTPVKDGDWTALVTFAPTFFIQGFFVEAWNYLSATHVPGHVAFSYNPGFWSYCIPYVSFAHVFEMPILGYLGYVPFSIYSFIWFLAMSFMMDIKTGFSFGDNFR